LATLDAGRGSWPASRPDMLWATVDGHAGLLVVDLRGEFRGQHRLGASAGDRGADQFFVVNVRSRVEKS
jgi:hypothetical protein